LTFETSEGIDSLKGDLGNPLTQLETGSSLSPRTLSRNIVEITHNIAHWGGEQAADAKQCAECYGLSGFDLLPYGRPLSVSERRSHVQGPR
jgi:hypothetical protein